MSTPEIDDSRNQAIAARDMLASFQSQRFQNVIALFDQLLQREPGLTPDVLVGQLSTVAGKDLTTLLCRSYAYNACWFCEMGMATCETCEGEGEVGERLHCVACHGLGKVICTVCRGSSFMSIDEVPGYFRQQVIGERLRLAARAFDDLQQKYTAYQSNPQVVRSLVRRLHHKCQQALGILRNCHPHVPRGQMEQVTLFNDLLRRIQTSYQQMTFDAAKATLSTVERLVGGQQAAPADVERARQLRSVQHQLEVARGYVDILERLGAAAALPEIRRGIEEIDEQLRGRPPRGAAASPVAASAAAAAPQPVAVRSPRSEQPLEFVTELTEEQIHDVWEMFIGETWGHERTLEDTRRCIAGSNVNVAIVRLEEGRKRVVAYVRAITDGVYRAVAYDFVVSRRERGGGLGRLLINRLMADARLRDVSAVEILCRQDLADYMRQLGFIKRVDGSTYLRYSTGKA